MEKRKIKNIKDLNKIVDNSKIKGLIFDFDGVITQLPIDYNSLRKALTKYFLSKYNFENNFTPLNTNLELVKKKLGKKALREAYKIIKKYELKSLSKAKLNKEIINFIKTNSSHKKIALFSMNMHKTIEKFLIKNKLLKYIHLIVAKDNASQYKPNPEGLYRILNKLHLNKKEVVFIGDKEIDLETGRAAGIKTVIILNN